MPVPVGSEALRVHDLPLHRVAPAGGQQRDAARVPPLVLEGDHGVVGKLQDGPRLDVDEPHRRALPVPAPLRLPGQRGEGPGDGGRVAQVVVQRERVEVDGGVPVPVEDALVLVGEHEQHAPVRVLEALDQRLPPQLPEVLSLVHDDRVEPVPVRTGGGQLPQPLGEPVLPVVGVVVLAGLRAPFDGQPVEQPDVRRALLLRPRPGHQLEVPCESPGVAHERRAVPVAGQPAGLEHGQVGLAGTGASGDLRAVLPPQQGQGALLLPGELVAGVLELPGEVLHVAQGQVGAAQVLDDQLHGDRIRWAVGLRAAAQHLVQPSGDAVQVGAVEQPVPRGVGDVPVPGQARVGQGSEERGPPAPTGQPRRQVVQEGVHPGPGLLQRRPLQPVRPTPAGLVPLPVPDRDVPALHLDHRVAHTRPQHQEIQFRLDLVPGDALPRDQHRVLGELGPQRLPDALLRLEAGRELRGLREGLRHGPRLPRMCHRNREAVRRRVTRRDPRPPRAGGSASAGTSGAIRRNATPRGGRRRNATPRGGRRRNATPRGGGGGGARRRAPVSTATPGPSGWFDG